MPHRTTPRTARALARETLTREILAAARERLTAEGPAALSLRAVARDVGMVSSAVYRYFPSRDALLTALIVECYEELGAAVERAEAAVDRDDLAGRWLAACRAVRAWAVEHPGEFALLYGTPVPGYAAPQDTIEPATRVVQVLVRVVVAASAAGARPAGPPPAVGPPAIGTPAVGRPDDGAQSLADTVAGASAFVVERGLTDDAPPETVARTLMAWTTVFGTVSFELFGHLVGSVTSYPAWFDAVATRLGADLGIVAPAGETDATTRPAGR